MAFLPKPQLLAEVLGVINRPDVAWAYTVQGDAIVGYWKWQDSDFFAGQVSQETQQYWFTVTLNDDGTYKEVDHVQQQETTIDSGGVSFSSNKSLGSVRLRFTELAPERDPATGEVKLVRMQFDTQWVKQPLRDYLTSRGWTKQKGLLGRLFNR